MTASSRLVRAAERARGQRTGDVTHDLVVFARLLRACGADVAPTASMTATRALHLVRLDTRADVRAALSASLVTSRNDRLVFDLVFDPFWSAEIAQFADLSGGEGSRGSHESTGPTPDSDGPPTGATGRGRDRSATSRRAVHSLTPGGRAAVTADHGRDIDDAARRLARTLGGSRGRRLTSGSRGDSVDLRTSMRSNLRFGDELLLLRRSTWRPDRGRLIVLCDVSSSMRPYVSLFLSFVHALTRLVHGVEAAVFNVDLLMVTEVFRRRDRHRALGWLQSQEGALAGGTRIGHCLVRFLDELEAGSTLRPGTVAVILSDGWDVGEPELLAAGMRRLREAARAVLWCDPHAAATGYRPQVRGMRAARPFCDHYLDFSSVASLAGLVSAVSREV